MNKSSFLLVLFLCYFVSCAEDQKNIDVESLVVTDLAFANQIKSSPEQIVIGSGRLTLYTYFWRDFMPSTEENGSPLMGVIRFEGQTGAILSNTISLSKLYVVNDNNIWICDVFETRIVDNDIWEAVFRNGPKWEPGIDVDVICEFESLGQSYRLMAKSQTINATY